MQICHKLIIFCFVIEFYLTDPAYERRLEHIASQHNAFYIAVGRDIFQNGHYLSVNKGNQRLGASIVGSTDMSPGASMKLNSSGIIPAGHLFGIPETEIAVAFP